MPLSVTSKRLPDGVAKRPVEWAGRVEVISTFSPDASFTLLYQELYLDGERLGPGEGCYVDHDPPAFVGVDPREPWSIVWYSLPQDCLGT